MSIVINHQTNDISATSGSLTIDGSAVGGGGASTLAGLSDVDVTTVAPTNGQVLKYNTTSSKWEPDDDNDSGGGASLISSATASNDATIEFTLDNSTYSSYQVVLDSLLPATDGAELFMRFSSDGGSTFDSGTGNYRYASRWVATNGATGSTLSESATAINLTNTIGTSAGETGANGKLDLNSSGEGRPSVRWQLSRTSSSNLLVYQNGGAERTATVEVDAIQFLMSTGNIASGKVYLYGLDKSVGGGGGGITTGKAIAMAIVFGG